MHWLEKTALTLFYGVFVLQIFLMGGCTDEKGLSKESECLFKATMCHVAKFDKETEVCTERDVTEGETCYTLNPCIYSCRCVRNEPQQVMLPEIDDGNQCTEDRCTANYAHTPALATVIHQDMPEGMRCGPSYNSEGQCRRGLCVMQDGTIYIDEPMRFNFSAD